jgi:indolepyruvate ferredoxin oxidoreductase beta subunit
MVYNIVLSGVGGQGILTAAKVLGKAAMLNGLYGAVGEIHGLAQRGGSVIGFVRISENRIASTVPEGTADLLIAFEPLESLRYINYARKGTTFVVNEGKIVHVSANLGSTTYPPIEDIHKTLSSFGPCYMFDATSISKELGSTIFVNSVMLGKSASVLKSILPVDCIKDALLQSLPRDKERNIKAFEIGFNA